MVEVQPADELPPAVPAPAPPPPGTIDPKEQARQWGRLGGLAKANRVRLVTSLGIAKIAPTSAFGPYLKAAEEYVAHQMAEAASQAGGHLGPGPSTMISSAALQLAASRFCFDQGAQTGDPDLFKKGSALADASRQNLLAAHELAARELKMRREQQKETPAPWLLPADPKDDGGK